MPLRNPNGTWTYKGKVYQSRADMPNDYIGSHSVRTSNLIGRGWDRPGYRVFIDIHGVAHRLVPANTNAIVEPGEITWGISNRNNAMHHVCYAGGLDRQGRVKNTLNEKQKKTLLEIMRFYMADNFAPDILFCGHNQFENKACPSFFVPKFCIENGIPERNIYKEDPHGYGR
jgi:hypothetical protein